MTHPTIKIPLPHEIINEMVVPLITGQALPPAPSTIEEAEAELRRSTQLYDDAKRDVESKSAEHENASNRLNIAQRTYNEELPIQQMWCLDAQQKSFEYITAQAEERNAWIAVDTYHRTVWEALNLPARATAKAMYEANVRCVEASIYAKLKQLEEDYDEAVENRDRKKREYDDAQAKCLEKSEDFEVALSELDVSRTSMNDITDRLSTSQMDLKSKEVRLLWAERQLEMRGGEQEKMMQWIETQFGDEISEYGIDVSGKSAKEIIDELERARVEKAKEETRARVEAEREQRRAAEREAEEERRRAEEERRKWQAMAGEIPGEVPFTIEKPVGPTISAREQLQYQQMREKQITTEKSEKRRTQTQIWKAEGQTRRASEPKRYTKFIRWLKANPEQSKTMGVKSELSRYGLTAKEALSQSTLLQGGIMAGNDRRNAYNLVGLGLAKQKMGHPMAIGGAISGPPPQAQQAGLPSGLPTPAAGPVADALPVTEVPEIPGEKPWLGDDDDDDLLPPPPTTPVPPGYIPPTPIIIVSPGEPLRKTEPESRRAREEAARRAREWMGAPPGLPPVPEELPPPPDEPTPLLPPMPPLPPSPLEALRQMTGWKLDFWG